MKRIVIAGVGWDTSCIGLGTASLHHLRGTRERHRLLRSAVDAGITHFDCAPYYGFGLAESALAVLAPLRERVTITTKVGLYPPGGADQGALRVWARKVAGRAWPVLTRAQADLDVRRARASLDGSLRRLRRERVDLLLLHEPDRASCASDEWQRWLQSERDRVAAIGVCGEPARVLPFVQAADPLAQVVQTRDSLHGNEAAPLRDHGRSPQFTYGHLARRPAGGPGAGEAVRQALARHPGTVVLVSTRRAERLAELAAAGSAT